jgi:hypothetical protein
MKRKKSAIILEQDYKDMISIFIEEKVQFLLVGGYAVGLHGHPRVWTVPQKVYSKLSHR